jgi:hypothetical protein
LEQRYSLKFFFLFFPVGGDFSINTGGEFWINTNKWYEELPGSYPPAGAIYEESVGIKQEDFKEYCEKSAADWLRRAPVRPQLSLLQSSLDAIAKISEPDSPITEIAFADSINFSATISDEKSITIGWPADQKTPHPEMEKALREALGKPNSIEEVTILNEYSFKSYAPIASLMFDQENTHDLTNLKKITLPFISPVAAQRSNSIRNFLTEHPEISSTIKNDVEFPASLRTDPLQEKPNPVIENPRDANPDITGKSAGFDQEKDSKDKGDDGIKR